MRALENPLVGLFWGIVIGEVVHFAFLGFFALRVDFVAAVRIGCSLADRTR